MAQALLLDMGLAAASFWHHILFAVPAISRRLLDRCFDPAADGRHHTSSHMGYQPVSRSWTDEVDWQDFLQPLSLAADVLDSVLEGEAVPDVTALASQHHCPHGLRDRQLLLCGKAAHAAGAPNSRARTQELIPAVWQRIAARTGS